MSKAQTISDYRKKIVKTIGDLGYRHSTWQVFSDFVEMSAIALSNTVDWIHREEREKRYLEIINTYSKSEQKRFPEMLAYLTNAMEDSLVLSGGPTDILGQVFHELKLHNKWKGQFFTPVPVCEAMGMMMVGDKAQMVKEKGFITVCEPCVGSGAMVLGFAKAMKANGMNYCSQMVVTAQDIDLKCVHMAYLQLSLYGIPAVVIHGNTLTVEEWSRWYTPVYMLDGWIWRQQCGMTDAGNKDVTETAENVIEEPGIVTEPTQIVIESAEPVKGISNLSGQTKRTKGKKKGRIKEEFDQLSLFDIAQ
jgi:hypothetical protein